MILRLLLATVLFTLTGCAWWDSHRPQINATLNVVVNRAMQVAEQVIISAAVSQSDATNKGNFLDSIALGLRTNEGSFVTADDVAAIVKAWAPANAPAHWTTLADQLAAIYAAELKRNGQASAAKLIESIAAGLNQAAQTPAANSVP